MNRDRLLEDVRKILAKTGFFLSEETNTRGLAFDIVARRDEVLLMVKVLLNVDAFSKQSAEGKDWPRSSRYVARRSAASAPASV